MRKCIPLLLLVLALVVGSATVVYAPEQSLNSGYAVTSNWHGIDVPLGSEVVVTAMTNDTTVYQVTFKWKNPGDQLVWTDVVPVSTDGITIDDGNHVYYAAYYASSTHNPEDIGGWGVKALFQGPDGTTKEGVDFVVNIKATSFNVIPEVPIIGTAGASLAMLLGFTYKIKRKPKK
jgi:hypothetical protein